MSTSRVFKWLPGLRQAKAKLLGAALGCGFIVTSGTSLPWSRALHPSDPPPARTPTGELLCCHLVRLNAGAVVKGKEKRVCVCVCASHHLLLSLPGPEESPGKACGPAFSPQYSLQTSGCFFFRAVGAGTGAAATCSSGQMSRGAGGWKPAP